MKLCKDCKYYINNSSGIFDWCVHPRFGVNPVDGAPNREYPSVERSEPFSPYEKKKRCGPEGLYFEQKEVKTESIKQSWLKILAEKWRERKRV